MKRELPLLITAIVGVITLLGFFVPHQVVSRPADFLQQTVVIVLAFGFVLGGANVLKVNLQAIAKKQQDWPYKLVLVVSLVVTVTIGLLDGRGWQEAGSRSMWLYRNVYSPMQATMFALLAFFVASAAFRAFRIRTFEAGLLAAAALVVMLGRVPLTASLTAGLPAWLQLDAWQQWILEVPQNAAKRAILIGAAIGVMSTGLRVILGLERAYLGGED